MPSPAAECQASAKEEECHERTFGTVGKNLRSQTSILLEELRHGR